MVKDTVDPPPRPRGTVTTGGCVCGHRGHVPGMCGGARPQVRCTCCEGVPMSQEATWVVRERSAARYQKQLAGICGCDHDLHAAWDCAVAICYCDRHWGLKESLLGPIGRLQAKSLEGPPEVASLWARWRDVLLFGTVGGIIGAGIVALVGALI